MNPRLEATLAPVAETGRCGLFLLYMLGGLRFTPAQLGSVLQQTFLVGARSLIIIMICGFFVGMVLALQAINALEQFGASDQVSLLVGKSLFRELGPVLTALLFAGRAGTSLTAEIGLMKAGEQLAAMEMMAVDPKARVLAPRLLAGLISMPLLAALFSAIGILGGYVVGVLMIGIDSGAFWSQMQNGVDAVDDVGNGIVKSFVFGIACTVTALYQGFEATPTPEGVSEATTRTVVISSLLVLGLDFVLTALMFSTPG